MDIFFRDMYDDILENLPKKKISNRIKEHRDDVGCKKEDVQQETMQ